MHRVIQKKNTTFDKFVYFIVGIFFLINYIITLLHCGNVIVGLLFGVIGGISYFEYTVDTRMFSMNKFIMIYLFIFESIAPFKQYVSNYNAWKLCDFSDKDYIISEIFIIIFLLVYIIGVKIIFKKVKLLKFTGFEKKNNSFIILTNRGFIFLTIEGVLCFLYLLYSGNIYTLNNTAMLTSDSVDTIHLFTLVQRIFNKYPIYNH